MDLSSFKKDMDRFRLNYKNRPQDELSLLKEQVADLKHQLRIQKDEVNDYLFFQITYRLIF